MQLRFIFLECKKYRHIKIFFRNKNLQAGSPKPNSTGQPPLRCNNAFSVSWVYDNIKSVKKFDIYVFHQTFTYK